MLMVVRLIPFMVEILNRELSDANCGIFRDIQRIYRERVLKKERKCVGHGLFFA